MTSYAFFDISNFPSFPRKLYLQPMDSLGTPVDVFCDQTEFKVSLFSNLKGSQCVLSEQFCCRRAVFMLLLKKNLCGQITNPRDLLMSSLLIVVSISCTEKHVRIEATVSQRVLQSDKEPVNSLQKWRPCNPRPSRWDSEDLVLAISEPHRY